MGWYDASGEALMLCGWFLGICSRRRIVVAVCLCAVIAALSLTVIFWEWLSGAESGSTTIRNVALVGAGLVALPLAIWRGVVADRQAKTAQQGLLNERYQKGAEMLGNDVLSVRLAGIYALQRLSEDYPEQYHLQVIRLLSAFVRLPTKDQSLESGQVEIESGTLLGIRPDLEAVMEVINCRSKSGTEIERGANYRLDLRGARLPGAQFLNADLSNTFFHHAILSGANFANSNLSDTFLRHADLSGSIFFDVKFTRTRFESANLSGALLQDLDLQMASFHYANLSGANLLKAKLSRAIFQDAVLTNAWLESSDLSNATFLRADLSGARLAKANLSNVQFLDANLKEADFSDANLSGAEFSIGGPQTAKGLNQAQLDGARSDPNNPPKLTGVLDSATGELLTWRGKPLGDGA